MKPNLRLQVLLAVACLGFVLSLMTVQVSTANLCTVEVPATGGYLVEGVLGRPQRINPLLADVNQVDRDLASLVFDGLTRYDASGQIVPALAQSWSVSEDGLTVTFTLAESQWHDGEPVTAADVAFTYGLLQDEALASFSRLAGLWRSVEIAVADERTVAFTLPTAYPPFLEATTRGLLPAHLLAGVSAAALLEHSFNKAPVGTGPFMVEPSNWERSGRLRLIPNPAHWQGGTSFEGIEYRFYPDVTTLVAAYRDGEIAAIHRVGPELLPQLASVSSARLFSSPAPRFTQALFNLSETGHPALDVVQVREALVRGLDRAQLIDEAINGQGLLLDGPYLPGSSAFRPDLMTARPPDVSAAEESLDASGWILPDGAEMRSSDGVELELRLLYEPVMAPVARAIQAQWSQIGVGLALEGVAAGDLEQSLRDGAFDVAIVEVVPLGDPDLYDFWSQEAIVRGRNFAGWNDRRASEALEAARQTWDPAERQAWYDRFLVLLDQGLPAITLYQHVDTYALSPSVKSLAGEDLAQIGLSDSLRDRYEDFPNWFSLYRDVLVSCPEETPVPE